MLQRPPRITEFEVGDVVVLRGQGQRLMTVTFVPSWDRSECSWFSDDGEFKTATIPDAALVKIP